MPRSLLSTLMLPTEGVYASKLPHLNSLPVQTFLPTGYEHNYAYPLVVLFHPHWGSDEQVLRLVGPLRILLQLDRPLREILPSQPDQLPGGPG